MTVVALLAAYNEADVIGQVVGDLIAQGVQVYLIDHASTDDTVARASPWLGRGLLRIERFPDESGGSAEDRTRYAWESLLLRKAALAAELEADWFLHTDADELRESPWPGTTLSQAIAAVDALGYDAIDFEVFNFCPTDDRFRPGDELRAAFPYYEPAAQFDRLQIKAWKKQRGPVDLATSGGHEVCFAGRRVFPLRFVLRHYPIRSQAHGERKVFTERRPRFVAGERQRGWHVQYDAVEPGHHFVRGPDELTRWDDLAVRLQLAVRNRAVEAAESHAAVSERAQAELSAAAGQTRIELDTVRRDRDARTSEAAGLYDERTRREADLAALRDELQALSRDRDQWAAQAGTLYTERGAREAELDRSRALAEARAVERDTLRVEGERWAAEAGALYTERSAREAEIDRWRALAQARAVESETLRVESDRVCAESETLRVEIDRLRVESQTFRVEADRLRVESETLRAGCELLRAERDTLRVESERWAAEAGALYREREPREAAIAELRRQLAETAAAFERELAAAHVELRARAAALANARLAQSRRAAEVDELDRALTDAHARLDQFYASRTWRWTTPARLAWRYLGRE